MQDWKCRNPSDRDSEKLSFLLYIFKSIFHEKNVSLRADVNMNQVFLNSAPAPLEVTNDSSMAAAAAKRTTSSEKDAH